MHYCKGSTFASRFNFQKARANVPYAMVGSFCPERLGINHELLSHKAARVSTGFFKIFQKSFMSHETPRSLVEWRGSDKAQSPILSPYRRPCLSHVYHAMSGPCRLALFVNPHLPQETCDKPIDILSVPCHTKLS